MEIQTNLISVHFSDKFFSLNFFCCIEMKCIYYVVLPVINTTEVEL